MSATIHVLPVRPVLRLLPRGKPVNVPDSWIERGGCDDDDLTDDDVEAILEDRAEAMLEARWDREHERDDAA